MPDDSISTGDALLAKKDRTSTVLFYIIIIFFVGFIVLSLFFTHNIVDGDSMQNTLQNEQFVILQRAGYTIKAGDIVTVGNIPNHDEPLIKRVVALGGDRVLFMRSNDGQYVDLYVCKAGSGTFKKVDEPYIKERMGIGASYETVGLCPHIADISAVDLFATDGSYSSERETIVNFALFVKKGEIFYLGDNRNHSSDSRVYGTSPRSDVLGKVIKIVDCGSNADKILSFLYK